jgi:phytoene desaturase
MAEFLTLVPLDPYYRVYFHDGSYLDYVGDSERMKRQMRGFNVEDADRYDDFMTAVRPLYDAVIPGRLGSQAFDSLGKAASVLPWLLRSGAYRSLTDVVDRHFADFRHRFLFSFHPLFIGGHPFRTPALYLMIPYLEREGDVWFPKGGIYVLVRAFRALFETLGGQVRTHAEVTRIEVEHDHAVGVTIGSETRHADLVVSNADVGHTYRDLLPPRRGAHWSPQRLDRLRYSMSCFVLYLGVRRKYPQLKHHTLIVGEDYPKILASIFDEKTPPDDLSMWLHMPTATDPSMAPEGCESLHVVVPVPNTESGIDWEKDRGGFADRILAALEDWGLLELRRHLEVMHTFTPGDFERQLNATHGSAFALEPTLMQTGWFRPHSRSEDMRNLYLVGAGTHPGAGVPAVLLSAEATYDCIATDFGLPPAPDRGRPESARATRLESEHH